MSEGQVSFQVPISMENLVLGGKKLPPGSIILHWDEGKRSIELTYDGQVILSDGVTWPESAKAFWDIIAETFPGMIKTWAKAYIEKEKANEPQQD